MEKIAIFPGSFDPFTKGHEDIVLRGLKVFDKVIIGIGHNANKQRFFPLDKMVEAISGVFAAYPNVIVKTYQGLTAHFAKENQAQFLLRGLRDTTDFEYENPISQANRHVYPDLETVFLITSPQYTYISSSIVRDLHRYGQDVSKFLPYHI